MDSTNILKAKCGRCCPLCDYYTNEEINPLGLKCGWYKESEEKLSKLIACNHIVPGGLEELLNSDISTLEYALKDARKRRKMIQKLKDK